MFWRKKDEKPQRSGMDFAYAGRRYQACRKLIDEIHPGGCEAFDKEFEADKGDAICAVLDELRAADMIGRVGDIFELYWKKLSEDEKQRLAKMWCIMALRFDRRLEAAGIDTSELMKAYF
jgi:hypothetical protein